MREQGSMHKLLSPLLAASAVAAACHAGSGAAWSKNGPPARGKEKPRVVLHFPKDKVVGWLYVFSDPLYCRQRHDVGQAIGDISVPADASIMLLLKFHGSGDLSWLEKVGAPNIVS